MILRGLHLFAIREVFISTPDIYSVNQYSTDLQAAATQFLRLMHGVLAPAISKAYRALGLFYKEIQRFRGSTTPPLQAGCIQ